jgi:NTE family protein
VESLPTSAREINARINHITFNQPMLRDVEVIEAVRRNAPGWLRRGRVGDRRLMRHRFHLIEAGRVTAALSPESKVKPDLELLIHLCAAGQTEADKWLARHGRAVGVRSSIDLAQHFLAARPGAATIPAPSRPTPEAAA